MSSLATHKYAQHTYTNSMEHWLTLSFTVCLANHRALYLHCVCMLQTVRWKVEQHNRGSGSLWSACTHHSLPWYWPSKSGRFPPIGSAIAPSPISKHSILHHCSCGSHNLVRVYKYIYSSNFWYYIVVTKLNAQIISCSLLLLLLLLFLFIYQEEGFSYFIRAVL